MVRYLERLGLYSLEGEEKYPADDYCRHSIRSKKASSNLSCINDQCNKGVIVHQQIRQNRASFSENTEEI